MTVEEIQLILQTVAENQAKHDELHSRHSADVAEIDAGIASLLSSQNRYDERLATISDILHDLADKQLKNEELFAENEKRFAELAAAQVRYEASYQLLEQFVRDFRKETGERFAQTDSRLAALNGSVERTDERLDRMAERVEAHDQQFDKIGDHLDQAAEAIKALAAAQARTDEQIRLLLDRNGSKEN